MPTGDIWRELRASLIGDEDTTKEINKSDNEISDEDLNMIIESLNKTIDYLESLQDE